MPDTAKERALRILGFRPPTLGELGAPRSTLDRIGIPGADSSSADIVVGISFLVALILAWSFIAVSDTAIAVRILCVAAIVVDVVMIVARVRYLLERTR